MTGIVGYSGSAVAQSVPVGRNALPVIARYTTSISASERKRLEKIADRLAANEPALVMANVFGAGVGPGLMEGPALLIGDVREIALSNPQRSEIYEYRISTLAADGDILLISGGRNTAFERYRNDVLGLGTLDVITLPVETRNEHVPLATRCALRPDALDAIAAKASQAGGLTILPYIGTGSVWVLAAAIAERAGTLVRVAAPPPRLTRRINDKAWFARRVAEVLGSHAQPKFRSVYGPAALAGQVERLARQADRLVIKVPDSAGSLGNISLSAADIRDRTLEDLRSHLLSVLETIGWRGRFPLLVEVWDSPVRANPSIQTWIPESPEGPPILEGIYEQVVTGTEGAFVGSVPAALPNRRVEQVTHEALKLATLFQHLGYFGRCSFDAVIAGNDYANAELHWIECNGRWGGVSMPMTLANRLVKNREQRVFVVVQLTNMNFKSHTIVEAQEMMGSDLFKVPGSQDGVVFLSPFGIENGSGVNLMAIAGTVERATGLAHRATQKLTGQPV
jgi:hypothetical protein